MIYISEKLSLSERTCCAAVSAVLSVTHYDDMKLLSLITFDCMLFLIIHNKHLLFAAVIG